MVCYVGLLQPSCRQKPKAMHNLLRDCETTKQTQDARSLKADAHNNNCKRNITLIRHYPNQPTIKVL